jgi:hypothetical protein
VITGEPAEHWANFEKRDPQAADISSRRAQASHCLRVGARLGPGRPGLAGWPEGDYRVPARSETSPAMARAVSWK